jgi:heme-degrading monooxygenase HmoA
MSEIAKTPKPPYYAVIFTSIRTVGDDGYAEMAVRMEELAREQEGFLGVEAARESVGITVSYWKDLESIKNWHAHAEHKLAQTKGYEIWYQSFTTRICKVERDYEFER